MNIEMILAARDRLKGHVRHTPLLSSPFIDEIAGRRVYVKPEALQHTGSFKFRGAWSAISALDDDVRARGVLAFSSGNHAQGIALAARQHGIRSMIVMPKDAPEIKVKNTKALGGTVVLYDRARESREQIGERLAAEHGLTLVRPYDEPQVIAGQATVGLEIAEDAANLGIKDVLVCCGGGGLSSGTALSLEVHAPDMNLRTVEPVGFDDVKRSLASGGRERNSSQVGSICDAILTPEPGELTFPILKRLAGSGLAVSDEDCLRAMAVAYNRLKIVLEPGGAVALAAALYHREQVNGEAIVAVASGGNVDAGVFARALTEFGETP